MKKSKKTGKKVYRINEESAQKMIDNITSGDNFVLLWIDTGKWGNRKKLAESLAEEWLGKNKDAVRAVQDLVNREEINKAVQPFTSAKYWVLSNPQVTPWIGEGIYCMPMYLLEQVDNRLNEAYQLGCRLLDEYIFNGGYDAAKKKFKKDFPYLYNEMNYPTKKDLRNRFRFRWGFQKIVSPSMGAIKTKNVTPAMVKREEQKWVDRIKEAGEATMMQVRSAWMEIITHLNEVLKDPQKRFKESTVEKPKEYLKQVKEVMETWGDKPFVKLAKEAEDLLDGVFADDLRDDEEYRKIIGDAVDEVVNEFKELPTVELKRSIDF